MSRILAARFRGTHRVLGTFFRALRGYPSRLRLPPVMEVQGRSKLMPDQNHTDSFKVRYRTLLLMEWLFERMGDNVAPVLPSVLPFLTELLEGLFLLKMQKSAPYKTT